MSCSFAVVGLGDSELVSSDRDKIDCPSPALSSGLELAGESGPASPKLSARSGEIFAEGWFIAGSGFSASVGSATVPELAVVGATIDG